MKQNKDVEQAMDRLFMLGSIEGKTKAHQFIYDCGVRPIQFVGTIKHRLRNTSFRIFIPPKSEDRIIMFEDNSGAYLHADGLVTFLGDDISNEISQWHEITNA